MSVLIYDADLAARVIAERKALGLDRYDEVWDGVYVMAAVPNTQHQSIVMRLALAFSSVVDLDASDHVFPGINLSDRGADWQDNYRCPDVVVFLRTTAAIDHGAHWQGPPDLAVEISSPGQDPRDKLDFYEAVGTRELLVIDRGPWQLELYRLTAGTLRSVGTSSPTSPAVVASVVLPLTFALTHGPARPVIDVRHATDGRCWVV